MAERYATVGELKSTGRMVSVLIEAGYDPSDDHEMKMGLTAYEAALLVCTHASPMPLVSRVQKVKQARAGRNDPCPCGSGKKFKKCCIDLNRPSLVGNDGPLIKFGPDVVPRLWVGDEAYEDYDRLSQIIRQDPAFADAGFPVEKMTAFMNTIFDDEPAVIKALETDDPEAYDQAFDVLCTRFLKEHGQDLGLSVIKDKCLEAAQRATSKDEARALATGICLSLMSEVSDDPADNPLAVILFRKSLFDAAGTMHIIDRVLNRFPSDSDELCRLVESNDPSINEKLEMAANELSPAEIDLLRADFDRLDQSLSDTIKAGEFPVPLPLATQLAMFGRLYGAASNGIPSRDEMTKALVTSPDDLIEEDYVQFGKMLDRWIEGSNGEQPGRTVEAVRTMRSLCAVRLIGDLVPLLFVSCLRERLQVPFDADELKFIEGASDATDKVGFMAEYSAWLRTKGYPGMADRLARYWDIDAVPQGKPHDAERRIA